MIKPELCKGCPLETSGSGYVYGEGPREAKVCLLGEALGAEEAYTGRPFVGGSGRVLNMLLGKAGLKRSEMFVTNVVRCRPPANREPFDAEAKFCTTAHGTLAFLQKFNLVIPLGNTALRFVAPGLTIGKWRGSCFESQGLKLLPTYHPAAVMRQQDFIPVVLADFAKAASQGWTREYTPPKQDYTLFAHSGQINALHDSGRPFAFDVETNSLDPGPTSITLLGLGNQPGECYVLANFRASVTLDRLRGLFASRLMKIGHNVTFDIGHMEANGVPVKWPWFDTMIAHHMVLSDVPNDLAFASSLYTQLPYWKHLSDSNLRFYNANDVDATIQLYTVLRQKLHMYGMDHVFETSMRVIPVLRAMKTTGVLVDSKRRLRYLVALDMQIKALERELMEKVQDPLFNWQSTKQLAELLYGKLGLPKMLNKKTGGVTTNEEALQDLYDHTHAPILAILLKLRKASKLASTYFEDQAAPSGRVHGEYLLHGTATGRLSSRSPNLQNIPKGPARSIYVPTPGNIFIQADYNQIELRVAAFLAREETLLEAFKQGLDVHRLVASEVYGKPMADITEDERFRAKFIVYGLGYGRGAASIAKQYNMSKTAAEAFIAKYFARFSKIKAWRTELIREAQKNGFLANAFGRRRWFFDQQMHTKVYNFPPQSTAADILLCALVKLHDELPEPARLVLTVHDSVLVECPPEQEATVIECMRTIMQQEYLPGLPVPVKIKSGLDWSACD